MGVLSIWRLTSNETKALSHSSKKEVRMSEVEQIVTYSQAECRAKAASKLGEAQALVLAQDAVSAGIALQCAQVWATLALSAPTPTVEVRIDSAPEGLRIPGVRLLTAADPEPDANPGDVFVDPSGQGARYLVRLDGHRWGWCDSLAEAEAMPAVNTGSWAKSMGCGIIGVRPATEREQVEFRNGTGGAALDLVRRLLATLVTIARDSGHAAAAHWLADCDAKAHTSFHIWQWPRPPEREDQAFTDSRVRLLEQLAHFVQHYPDLAAWLRAVGKATAASDPWPNPHGSHLGLTVRVENPEEDLKQLTGDTLARLRDQCQALIAERAKTDGRVR